MTYQVQVEPDGPYWSIWVPAIKRATQAKRLKDIDMMAKELISIMTDEKDPAINVEMQLPQEVKEAQKMKKQADELASKAQSAQKNAVQKLHHEGMPYRDIGTLLGISYQRAQQLATA
jgi:DNA-directed RNA polymerase specialized sigma24 family protein